MKSKVYKVVVLIHGRSLLQRTKIESLGLTSFFDDIVISEEFGTEITHVNNFKYFENLFGPQKKYIYVGENTAKDFIAPIALGWIVVCFMDMEQTFTSNYLI